MAIYYTNINKKVYFFDGFTEKGALNRLEQLIGYPINTKEMTEIHSEACQDMTRLFDSIDVQYEIIPQRMCYICAATEPAMKETQWALATPAESKEAALHLFTTFISVQKEYFGIPWEITCLKLKDITAEEYEIIKKELGDGFVSHEKLLRLATDFTN